MRFAFFLALRYLRAPRRHRLAQFTSLVAIVGIAVGVAALIIAQSAARGFRQAMQEKILQNTAHITVFQTNGAEISDNRNLCEKIKQIKGIESISLTSFDNALLVGKGSSELATLRGISNFKFQISNSENKSQKPIVEIGKSLAEKIGLSAGDSAEIVSGSGNIGENFSPTSTTVEVGGVFSTGLYEYDSTWIRVSLEDAAKLTGKNEISPTALEIKTNDIYQSNKIAAEIQKTLGADFKVLDWQEANRPLFAALSLERRIAVLIISLVVFVAVLNITTTLALVVNERKSDIAVLKTCGARPANIVLIFLFEGALLGAIGATLGVLLGLTICFLANYFNFVSLPQEVYSISEIRLENNFMEIFLTVAAAFLLSLLASAIPAWMAARVRPLENLKN